jgi:lipopolysaccharide/colanic/teichoic acid biosynthesis glycosyltransferase
MEAVEALIRDDPAAVEQNRVVRLAPRVPAPRPDGGKRILDVVLSMVLLVLLAPLMLIIALLVKLDSRGPVFFRQRRLGLGMAPTTIVKFRTMRAGVSQDLHRRYISELARNGDDGDGLKKLTHDPRVTRVGRVLRRLSLDELPQLFNVVGGSMSLIGPRPALPYELEHYRPQHYQRFAVRPGITGLWQVSGRNRLGFEEMLDLDARYAGGRTLRTDLAILVRTPVAAVRDAA